MLSGIAGRQQKTVGIRPRCAHRWRTFPLESPYTSRWAAGDCRKAMRQMPLQVVIKLWALKPFALGRCQAFHRLAPGFQCRQFDRQPTGSNFAHDDAIQLHRLRAACDRQAHVRCTNRITVVLAHFQIDAHRAHGMGRCNGRAGWCGGTWIALWIPHNLIERALYPFALHHGDFGINRGRFQFGVAQQLLNKTNVRAAFQQMRGKPVAQTMWRQLFLDTSHLRRALDDALDRAGRQVAVVLGLAWRVENLLLTPTKAGRDELLLVRLHPWVGFAIRGRSAGKQRPRMARPAHGSDRKTG